MKFPKIHYLNKQKPITTTDWKYDLLGQVEEAYYNTNQDHSYEYDTIGNRRRSGDSSLNPAAVNYTSNAQNLNTKSIFTHHENDLKPSSTHENYKFTNTYFFVLSIFSNSG